MSRLTVNVLDLTIYVCDVNNTLQYKPFVKPSSLGVPLSSESLHLPSVHRWPIGENARLARISSNPADYLVARRGRAQRLANYYSDEQVIDEVMSTNAFKGYRSRRSAAQLELFSKTTWFVLPGHPLWRNCNLNWLMDSVINHPSMKSLWLCKHVVPLPVVKCSWTNPTRHFHLCLRDVNKKHVI